MAGRQRALWPPIASLLREQGARTCEAADLERLRKMRWPTRRDNFLQKGAS